MPQGQLLVFFFKLAPILFLWLVPMGDPSVAAAEIDRELSAEMEEEEHRGEDKPAPAPATGAAGKAQWFRPVVLKRSS